MNPELRYNRTYRLFEVIADKRLERQHKDAPMQQEGWDGGTTSAAWLDEHLTRT